MAQQKEVMKRGLIERKTSTIGFWIPKLVMLKTIREQRRRIYSCFERKVVGKSARDNPEKYCGCFLVHCFSKKLQRMAGEARDVCLRVLKESNKGRFDNYSVRNKCIDHIPYYLSGLSRAKFLRQSFSK